jgi:hypothetical protein
VKWFVLALLCVGCGGDCVYAQPAVLVAGTGSLGGAALDDVQWIGPGAPAVTNDVSFMVQFANGESVSCERIPWKTLSHGVVVDVAESCAVFDPNASTEAPLSAATLSAESTIDATNTGTLTLHFDVPAQDNTIANVSITGLVASITFEHTSCGGSSWGFWDI